MKQSLLTLALLLGGVALAQTAPVTPAPTTPAPAAPAQPTPAQPAPATPAPTAPAAPATATPDPQAVVAQVGGESFTLAQYEQAFRIAVARVLNAQGVPYTPDMLTEFADARADFLTQYARDRGVYQLARRNTTVTAAQVDEQFAKARQDFATDAEFAEALTATGFGSEADLRADIERQAVVQAYLDSTKKRFNFGDALVASFYNLNRASFNRPAEACAKHILVATQAEGQAVLTELQGGADFAVVAKARSQDPGSAAQGGDLGCLAPGDTVEAFDRASFNGPLNQPQLIQTEFGWHVLVVTKRNAAGLAPLAEVAPLIREQLARDAAQKYLDSQLARLNITTNPAVVVTVPAAR